MRKLLILQEQNKENKTSPKINNVLKNKKLAAEPS